MKKYIKLLIALFVFIPISKVNAGIPVTINSGSEIGSNIYWFADYASIGSIRQFRGKSGSYGVYHYPVKSYKGNYRGTSFDAVCIDPGAHKTSGETYNCEVINDPDILGLFKDKGNYSEQTFITAVRMKAAKRGYISNSKYNSMVQYRSRGLSAFGEGSASSASMGNISAGSFFRQADTMSDQNFTKPEDASGDANPNSEFHTSFISSSGKEIKIKITSNFPMKKVPSIECTNNCEGPVTVQWPVGSKEGTITLTPKTPAPCNANLKIKYVAYNNGSADALYYCSPNGGGVPSGDGGGSASEEQAFLAYISGSAIANDGGTAAGSTGGDYVTGERVSNDTSSAREANIVVDTVIPDSYKKQFCENGPQCCNITAKKEKAIKFCCTDGTHSEVKEPKINEIFCTKKKNCGTDEDIVVDGAYDLYAGNYDKGQAVEGSNYCKIYCTERIYVDIPSGIQAVNGKYFDLKGASSIDGPVIQGNFACRNVIEYDKWVKNYYKKTKEIVDNYNNYQLVQAKTDGYKKAFHDASKNGETSYTVKFSYEKDLVGYDALGENDAGKHSCTGTGEGSCTAKMSYEYHLESGVTVKYGQAKLTYNGSQTGNNLPLKNFERFDVKNDDDKSITTKTGYYGLKYKNNDSTFKCESINTTGSVSCYVDNWCIVANADGTCAEYETGSHKLEANDGSIKANSDNHSDKPNDSKSEIDADNPPTSSSYKTASEAADIYSKSVEELEKLYKEIDICDNYFNDGASTYTNFLNNKFEQPKVSFSWFYTYLSASGVIRATSPYVENYKLKNPDECKIHPSGGEWTGGTDSETGAEAPHYDTTNSHRVAKYKTFSSHSVTCNNNRNEYCSGGLNNSKLTSLLAEQSKNQKYTSDTKFEYKCEYEPDESTKKSTVYPYGGFVEGGLDENKKAYTVHDGKIYIEYSTLNAEYQTTWDFHMLGTKTSDGKGKFDDDFANGEDCTRYNNDVKGTSNLFCTLTVKESLTKVRGCNLMASLMGNSPNFWKKVCCKTPSCETTNDDTLSFSFKIVDSRKLFPGTNGYNASDAPKGKSTNGTEGSYAYNWFETDLGRKNLKQIESSSGNDREFNADKVSYQFHLNSKAITTIKEYNARVNNYNSLVGGNYTKGTTDENAPAAEYHSEFIENFYKDQIQLYKVANGVATKDGSPVKLKTKTYGGLSDARCKVYWDGVRKTSC